MQDIRLALGSLLFSQKAADEADEYASHVSAMKYFTSLASI